MVGTSLLERCWYVPGVHGLMTAFTKEVTILAASFLVVDVWCDVSGVLELLAWSVENRGVLGIKY